MPQLLLSCRIRQSVETASAAAAKEVARADALARAARKAKKVSPALKELEQLKVLSAACLSGPTHLSCRLHASHPASCVSGASCTFVRP